MDNMVLDFINRRFQNDCNWCTGNCYYFALILQDRFGGRLLYDPIDGHFFIEIEKQYYDWRGLHQSNCCYYWDEYPDELEKSRIIRDCIK